MRRALALCFGPMALVCAFAEPGYAQATRTWVSGVGDDVNPCSRTAPCKTFAGAISKTAAGGEINCLDPGGYGTLTITKSITIDCSDVFGSVLNSGGINGFVINDSLTAQPNTIEVVIRGVHINGAGTTLGLNAVNFISGASLTLENVTIEHQSAAGVHIRPSAAARINIVNTTITNVGTASAGRGININPNTNGNARVHIMNSRIVDNNFEGIRVDAAGNTNPNAILVGIENTQISGGATGIIAASSPGLSFVRVAISNSHIFNNTTGITSFGTPSTVLVGSSVLTGNTSPTSLVAGGIIQTYGNNQTQGNTNAASFTAPPLVPN